MTFPALGVLGLFLIFVIIFFFLLNLVQGNFYSLPAEWLCQMNTAVQGGTRAGGRLLSCGRARETVAPRKPVHRCDFPAPDLAEVPEDLKILCSNAYSHSDLSQLSKTFGFLINQFFLVFPIILYCML